MMSPQGLRKVAVLFSVVGEVAAARLLGPMSDAEQLAVGRVMAELARSGIDAGEAEKVLEEFDAELRTASEKLKGAPLLDVLSRAHGPELARSRLSRIEDVTPVLDPFTFLEVLDPVDVATVLEGEHPQVRAFVLAASSPGFAAEVLACFEKEDQIDLVFRMASMNDPSPRMLRKVAQQLVARTRELDPRAGPATSEDSGRVRAVARVLNASGPGTDRDILSQIEPKDQALAQEIREQLFTWTDLAKVDKRTMQRVLAGIDTKALALAIKGCEPALLEAILGAMSQRTKDMILEERELIGAVPLTEVNDARRQILTVVRDLIESGEVVIERGGRGTQNVA